jgi:LysM domain
VCCDNTLINGYGHSAKRMTLAIAYESCQSLEYRAPLVGALILGVALVAIACAVVFKDSWLPRHAQTPVAAATAPATQPDARSTPPVAASPPQPPSAAAEAGGLSGVPEASASAPQGPAAPESPALYDPLAAAPVADSRRQAPAGAGANPGNPALARAHTRGPSAPREWVVRKGDTVIKVCEAVYRDCDDQTFRKIMARNPEIGRNALIYPGQILKLPKIAPSAE